MVFVRKGLTNPSKKHDLKNGYNGARSDPKHVIEMGSIFLPKGLNKSVVKIQFRKGLSNPSSMVFVNKGLTNPSKKHDLKNGYNGARSDPKHVIEMGSIFLPKGLNKSVVKIQFRKGLSNPSSMVFGRKGLTNLSIYL